MNAHSRDISHCLMPSADELEQLVARFGSPLMLCSPQRAVDRYRTLAAAFPRAQIFYAIKSSPHPPLIAALAEAGAGFDVASTGEIDLLRAEGIGPARCLHSHPIKRPAAIREALDYGCRTFIADNPEELRKFVPWRDRARILLRVRFDNPDAVVDLGCKFGASPTGVPRLLALAVDLGLDVRGLSFHVGSQNLNARRYVEAIQICHGLFEQAAHAGVAFDTLDIGGGFPVLNPPATVPLESYTAPIAAELDRLFPEARIWLEPGRFISAPAMTLVTTVIGRARREGVWWYYIDDGLYGSYSGKVFDKADYPITCVSAMRTPDVPLQPVVIAGPTCDGFDVVYPRTMQPDCPIGEIFVSPMVGAYSWASASDFNSMPRPTFVDIDRVRRARRLA